MLLKSPFLDAIKMLFNISPPLFILLVLFIIFSVLAGFALSKEIYRYTCPPKPENLDKPEDSDDEKECPEGKTVRKWKIIIRY